MQTVAISRSSSWDYKKAKTKYYTHCFHSYPAMMIPQIARRLIGDYAPDIKLDSVLFDPFCGTGTTLVEGVLNGLNVIGTDINPLAKLIAKAKCTLISKKRLNDYIDDFSNYLEQYNVENPICNIPNFKNLHFWFRENIIYKLAYVKEFITYISDEDIRNFFLVAFSETVRDCSLTKKGEFKLVRIPKQKIEDFNPNVFKIVIEKLHRNKAGLESFSEVLGNRKKIVNMSVHSFNTVDNIPSALIEDESVDLVVTSPPYGDSSTTVAYGQYSRLSNQWMGIEDAFSIDNKLMGGVKSKELECYDIPQLDAILKLIAHENYKRALTVSSFYSDLNRSCRNISKKVKRFGYVCYVVSNRKVQGRVLPTGDAVVEFFCRSGFQQVDSFNRIIPNKRMPSRNSPTNISGKVDSTMTREQIIVMQKLFDPK
jgi:tRNA G10  N-methylase Trm11